MFGLFLGSKISQRQEINFTNNWDVLYPHTERGLENPVGVSWEWNVITTAYVSTTNVIDVNFMEYNKNTTLFQKLEFIQL